MSFQKIKSICRKSNILLVFIVVVVVGIFDCYLMQISEIRTQSHKIVKNLGLRLIQHIQSVQNHFESYPQSQNETEKQYSISNSDIKSSENEHESEWEMTGEEIMNILSEKKVNNTLSVFTDYLISTPGCKLPRTKLMPEGFKMKKKIIPQCKDQIIVSTLDPISQILQLLPNYTRTNVQSADDAQRNHTRPECTVTEILRPSNIDSYEIGTTKNITDSLDMSKTELFVTKCGNLTTFDAHFPLKPEVEEKMKYWESQNQDDENLPFSILFLGFDTTSRSHYYRSIPKTLNVLQQMGFIDFMGYHAIAPYTLENFLAFLVGMPTVEVRAKCAADWSTPFDKCPLIWKNYNWNKFVTMYTEDGSQTFNWGGQSGFTKRPTDYYTHPIFISTKPFRKKYGIKDKCLSNKNDQQFMLDYTKRFVKKFENVPFFSFTWFANPFHDSTYALHGFDENMTDFFQVLQSSKQLLKRTMIVLVSDHGERHGSFVRTGYEGFLERSLPGLFIRLPDLLLEKYPNLQLKKILKTNTRRLTTGFDIFHTFQHMLILSGLNISENVSITEFQPVLPDRSSLFVPISKNRDCNMVNIFPGVCVCNASSNALGRGSSVNPFLSNQMINFAIDELNALLSSSKYKNECKTWSKPMLSLLSNYIVANTTNTTDTTLQFIASPAKAQFQVQVRFIHDNNSGNLNTTTKTTNGDKFKRISPFSRLNQYKDASWCVNFETDEDKKMKETCYCKGKKKTKTSDDKRQKQKTTTEKTMKETITTIVKTTKTMLVTPTSTAPHHEQNGNQNNHTRRREDDYGIHYYTFPNTLKITAAAEK